MFHVEQFIAPECEVWDWFISELRFNAAEINRPPQQPGRCAGLQPSQLETDILQ